MNGRYQTDPNFIHRKVAGMDVLISIGGRIADFNGYITLNPTASFLWDAMKQPQSVEELTDALTAEFDVSVSQAQEDIRALLTRLLEQSMIVEVPQNAL